MIAHTQLISDSPAVLLSGWDRGDRTVVYGYEIFTPEGKYVFESHFSDPVVCNDGEANEFMAVLRSDHQQIEVRNHTDDRIHSIGGHHFYLHCQHKNFRSAATP